MPLKTWLAALSKRRRKTGGNNAPEHIGTAPDSGGQELPALSAQPQTRVITGTVPLSRAFGPQPFAGGRKSVIRDAGDLICAVAIMVLIALALLPIAPDSLVRAVEDRTGIHFRRAAVPPAQPFFSLGATAQEVTRIEGQPTAIHGETWFYGRSEVYFSNGRVVGWRSSKDHALRTPVPATW